ncbi:MAG: TlpA family protein disulfide reductase [Terrimicrobiaceae bacterium]
MFPIIRRFTLIVAVAFTANSAFADPAADEAWKKVEEAMNNLKKPATPPKNRDEAVAFIKSGLAAFDTVNKEFSTAASNDPRRWQVKLFEAQFSGARRFAGLPPGPDMMVVLNEIAAAPDAPSGVKGEASGIQVLIGSRNMPEADWQKLAEKHLQAYPEAPMNQEIKTMIARNAETAKWKSEPLDLKFTAVDGAEVDLAKMRGKVVLLDFWATWCGPCVKEVPNLVKSYDALHAKGFEIVGISLDKDKAKLESFLKENGMAWPQYFDGKGWQNDISSRFGIQSIPAMWLVNKKGMLVSTNARGNLADEVEKLLAE